MNLWLKILAAAAFLVFLYGMYCLLAVLFARHELDASDAVKRRDDAIEIFADAESLEYYLRMALAASDENIAVVAYVKKDSADRDDMIDTVTRLHREHKNLSYRLI